MSTNDHPMGRPIEPTQWFVTFMAEDGRRFPTVQVQANGAADAASITRRLAGFFRQEIVPHQNCYTAVLVRSRHKKLPLLNSSDT